MLLASFSSLLVMSETEGSYWLLLPPGVPSQAFAGLLMSVLGLMAARQPLLFLLGWWDTASLIPCQRRASLCHCPDVGRGLTCRRLCRTGPVGGLLTCTHLPLVSLKCAVETHYFLPRIGLYPQKTGSGDTREARPPDSWVPWRLAMVSCPVSHPAAGCPLNPQGHSLVSSPGSSPPWMGICCQLAYCLRSLPREGSFSSGFQSLVVGGRQLVRAWLREGSGAGMRERQPPA